MDLTWFVMGWLLIAVCYLGLATWLARPRPTKVNGKPTWRQ
jgi:hypothetical protein